MEATMNMVAPYAKAIIAALLSGLTAIATGLAAGGLSWSEVVAALIAFLVSGGAVFSVPNRPPFERAPEHVAPSARI